MRKSGEDMAVSRPGYGRLDELFYVVRDAPESQNLQISIFTTQR